MNLSTTGSPERTLARAVLGLPDSQLACQECLADLPTYTDAELGGIAGRGDYRLVKRHILTCPRCGETYVDLLQMSLLEQSGQLLQPDRFPQPDLSFLSGARRDD